MLAASRQVWLAALGAAVVTREWAEKEAGAMVRTLVREGTVVESRAIRFVGDRVETSVMRANALWRGARTSLQSAVRNYADGAVTLVRDTLPRALPTVELPAMLRRDTPAPARVTQARRAATKAGIVRGKSSVKTAKRGATTRSRKRAVKPAAAKRGTRRAGTR
jgi:hypothetical protein